MRSRILVSGALALGALAAIGAVTAVRAPAVWLERLARNPFGFSTRVAPSGAVLLQQVQRLDRLETCRYRSEVIVEGSREGWLPVWLAGDRLLFVAQGEVVAGVDLARLSPSDVRVAGERVDLRLPEPEVLHTRLDSLGSRVYSRQTGILTPPDPHLETRVRLEAEERIRAAALREGVLSAARDNARDALRAHLALMGFRQVRFL